MVGKKEEKKISAKSPRIFGRLSEAGKRENVLAPWQLGDSFFQLVANDVSMSRLGRKGRNLSFSRRAFYNTDHGRLKYTVVRELK